jgi:hypothetical protein
LRVPSLYAVETHKQDILGKKTDSARAFACCYRAPEKLALTPGGQLEFGAPSDMWSFGITFIQLAMCDLRRPYGVGLTIENIRIEVCGS